MVCELKRSMSKSSSQSKLIAPVFAAVLALLSPSTLNTQYKSLSTVLREFLRPCPQKIFTYMSPLNWSALLTCADDPAPCTLAAPFAEASFLSLWLLCFPFLEVPLCLLSWREGWSLWWGWNSPTLILMGSVLSLLSFFVFFDDSRLTPCEHSCSSSFDSIRSGKALRSSRFMSLMPLSEMLSLRSVSKGPPFASDSASGREFWWRWRWRWWLFWCCWYASM